MRRAKVLFDKFGGDRYYSFKNCYIRGDFMAKSGDIKKEDKKKPQKSTKEKKLAKKEKKLQKERQ